jgi:hypothetical protein
VDPVYSETYAKKLVDIAKAHGCHAQIMDDGRVLVGSPATQINENGTSFECSCVDIVANWTELRIVLGY